ncbi:MAG: LysR family transcriptional regulator [Magnetospirillum sp. WYHS-4]
MAHPRSARPKVRILIGAATQLGPGKVDLLEAVGAAGSIAAAARRLGMSYRRAWLLIDLVNRCFRGDLVVRNSGGKDGGGARVTPLGGEVLRRYREIEDRAIRAVRRELESFAELLAEPADDRDLPPVNHDS